jgi:predicted CoA-binding protein
LEYSGTGATCGVTIPEILAGTHLWFVVGLGNNPERAAFGVSKFLQEHGKQIVPIYPRAEIVHGEQGFKTIADAAEVWGPPDVVDVFVRSSRAGEFADQAIAAGAKVVWFQVGVVDHAAAERVTQAGATMVMDTCPVIEWPTGWTPSPA